MRIEDAQSSLRCTAARVAAQIDRALNFAFRPLNASRVDVAHSIKGNASKRGYPLVSEVSMHRPISVPSISTRPSFALLLGLAWLVIVVQLLADHWTETAHTLSDMDDAMRLVQARAFFAGRGWFDLHEMRLGPPDGYDTHWSRLIDAGLVGLFWLFGQFTDAAFAERLARALWPMLWLIPTMAGAAAIAWRIAGRPAALTTLLLTVVGLPAFQHFIPGRIDHHNVQIALSVLLVAAAAWSDRVRWAATAAGVLTGAAMAIGFEGLPYILLGGLVITLRFVIDPAGAGALLRYGLAGVVSVLAAFFVSIGPAHWTLTACDAIAINSVVAVAVATLGLAVCAARFAQSSWQVRLAGVLILGAVATVLFIAIEPQCVAGPFAMMDRMVRTIWFSHVSEMQPLWTVARTSPAMGAAVAAFPVVAVLCTLALARDPDLRRDFGFLVAAAALTVAVIVMVVMVRAFSYAMWLAMPLVATGALRLCARLKLGSLAARVLVALFLTPLVTSAVAFAAVNAIDRNKGVEENSRVAAGCLQTENYARLAVLPPGLVVTDIDYGPFVLALTPHAVLSAPYHRLVAPIIDADRVFALPPDPAHAVAEGIEAKTNAKSLYLMVCGRHTSGGIGAAKRAASLWGRLEAGEIPDWLEPVSKTGEGPLRIYRVRP